MGMEIPMFSSLHWRGVPDILHDLDGGGGYYEAGAVVGATDRRVVEMRREEADDNGHG
jgi:hypothetical protein